jgi:cytochrome c biogenesis factor
MILLAVSAILWLATVVMIVAAFMRNDPELVGASTCCFIEISCMLAFAVWVLGFKRIAKEETQR